MAVQRSFCGKKTELRGCTLSRLTVGCRCDKDTRSLRVLDEFKPGGTEAAPKSGTRTRVPQCAAATPSPGTL